MASIDLDELVEHWTVLEDERTLVDAKRGATRLGFALLLKFYGRHGRFPTEGSELPGEVVAFVARQLRAAPADLGSYDWIGRSIERHRAADPRAPWLPGVHGGRCRAADGVAGGACGPGGTASGAGAR